MTSFFCPLLYEMKPLRDVYADTRPVYALEWPGFGGSACPDIRFTPELMTSARRALVAELGPEGDVVGLSLGSEFAARAALAEPCLCPLALISPSGPGEARTQEADDEGGGPRLSRTLDVVGTVLYAVLRTRPSTKDVLGRSFWGR